jgi:hypothetical protein
MDAQQDRITNYSKKEASDLASKVNNINFAWSHDQATETNIDFLQKLSEMSSTPTKPTSPGHKKGNPPTMIRQSQQPRQHIHGRGWRKNGRRNAKHGSLGKVSYAESP